MRREETNKQNQIQSNFTEMFLIMPSTKFAQMVLLNLTKRLPEL